MTVGLDILLARRQLSKDKSGLDCPAIQLTCPTLDLKVVISEGVRGRFLSLPSINFCDGFAVFRRSKINAEGVGGYL